MPSDPWGDDEPTSTVVVEAPAVKVVVEEEPMYACPHCGEKLMPHYDRVGSLHCNGKECVGCCFLPPTEGSEGKVRSKFEARPCPTAARASGF